jgi:Ca2+-binding EF-hand superfamily protein
VFDKYDSDKNGHLDRKELRQFMTEFFEKFGINLPLTDEYVDATFREIDADHSNTIEREEILSYLKTFMASLNF